MEYKLNVDYSEFPRSEKILVLNSFASLLFSVYLINVSLFPKGLDGVFVLIAVLFGIVLSFILNRKVTYRIRKNMHMRGNCNYTSRKILLNERGIILSNPTVEVYCPWEDVKDSKLTKFYLRLLFVDGTGILVDITKQNRENIKKVWSFIRTQLPSVLSFHKKEVLENAYSYEILPQDRKLKKENNLRWNKMNFKDHTFRVPIENIPGFCMYAFYFISQIYYQYEHHYNVSVLKSIGWLLSPSLLFLLCQLIGTVIIPSMKKDTNYTNKSSGNFIRVSLKDTILILTSYDIIRKYNLEKVSVVQEDEHYIHITMINDWKTLDIPKRIFPNAEEKNSFSERIKSFIGKIG